MNMKKIAAPVGQNGRNLAADVMTVQFLLNCVPPGRGGPVNELTIDGLCGPLTTAVIGKFQQSNLRFADRRVDPGGRTLAALHGFDPFPSMEMPALIRSGKAGGKGKGGKAGGGGKSARGGHVLHDHPSGAKHSGKKSSDFPSKGAPQDFPFKSGHGSLGGKHSDPFRPGDGKFSS